MLGDELPYQTAVVLDVLEDKHDQINLDATNNEYDKSVAER